MDFDDEISPEIIEELQVCCATFYLIMPSLLMPFIVNYRHNGES